jgi:hypothetical protein
MTKPTTVYKPGFSVLWYANKRLPDGGFKTLGKFRAPFYQPHALAEAKERWPETEMVAFDAPGAE